MIQTTAKIIGLLWPYLLATATIISSWATARAEVKALKEQVQHIETYGSVGVGELKVNVAAHAAYTRQGFAAINQRLDRIERKLDRE